MKKQVEQNTAFGNVMTANAEFQKKIMDELESRKAINQNVATTIAAAGAQMASFQDAMSALQTAVKKSQGEAPGSDEVSTAKLQATS